MIMTTMTEENIATVDALLTTSITPVVINIFSIVTFYCSASIEPLLLKSITHFHPRFPRSFFSLFS